LERAAVPVRGGRGETGMTPLYHIPLPTIRAGPLIIKSQLFHFPELVKILL
jgi:hypothetical protein